MSPRPKSGPFARIDRGLPPTTPSGPFAQTPQPHPSVPRNIREKPLELPAMRRVKQ